MSLLFSRPLAISRLPYIYIYIYGGFTKKPFCIKIKIKKEATKPLYLILFHVFFFSILLPTIRVAYVLNGILVCIVVLFALFLRYQFDICLEFYLWILADECQTSSSQRPMPKEKRLIYESPLDKSQHL